MKIIKGTFWIIVSLSFLCTLTTTMGVVSLHYLWRPDLNVQGIVTDASTGRPIQGARLKFANPDFLKGPIITTTDSWGRYCCLICSYPQRVTLSATGYKTTDDGFELAIDGESKAGKFSNFTLNKI